MPDSDSVTASWEMPPSGGQGSRVDTPLPGAPGGGSPQEQVSPITITGRRSLMSS